jgi:hypothetical protein
MTQSGTETIRCHPDTAVFGFFLGMTLFCFLGGSMIREPFHGPPHLFQFHTLLIFLYILSGLSSIGVFLTFPRHCRLIVKITIILFLSVFLRIAFEPSNQLSAFHPLRGNVMIRTGMDIVLITILIRGLMKMGLDIRWSLLYGLNPVVIYFWNGLTIPDCIFLVMVTFIFGSGETDRGLPSLLAVCFAVICHWQGLFLGPFVFRKMGSREVVVLLVSLALGIWMNTFLPQSFFGQTEVFISRSGPVYSVFRMLGVPEWCAQAFCYCGSAIMIPLIMFRFRTVERDWVSARSMIGTMSAFSVLFVFSDGVSCYVMACLLVFAALRQSFSVYFVCWLTGICLLVQGGNVESVIYILVSGLTVLFLGNAFRWDFCMEGDGSAPRNISVVVPALNEELRIGTCVQHLRQSPSVIEVIVVDGGSKDETVKRSIGAGAEVIRHDSPPGKGGGRGGQINAGIRAARGDAVAVVHADTVVTNDVFERVLDVLSRNPDIPGGACGTVFDRDSWNMKVIEILNHMRAGVFGISFGDQIQFFRMSEYRKSPLFPDMPLMEDVEFSLRLKRLGRIAYLFGSSSVSSRRWEKTGGGNVWTVLRYFTTYLMRRLWGLPDTSAMFNAYYGNRG